MIIESYQQIVTPQLAAGAVFNDDHPGFHEDYLVLHCLLRRWRPQSVLEIGTCLGRGTNIICCAVPEAIVYSLDLPYDQCDRSRQHVAHTGGKVGEFCQRPYHQLLGDSLEFDFRSLPPIEAAYVDGEHDTLHVAVESGALIDAGVLGIIWHDTDIPDVLDGIRQAFAGVDNYRLARVIDTRITYAERTS